MLIWGACYTPSAAYDAAECLDDAPGKPPCPSGYLCGEDYTCVKECAKDVHCAGEFGAGQCAACIGGICRPNDCYEPRCGNNVIDESVGEVCDDGNDDDGDYCSGDCRVDTGICGDGTIQANEVCDDGNTYHGDYCQYDCQAVTGSCGDRGTQDNEQCDDGNIADGDYCSGDCQLISGTCGDGVIQNNENCDDGIAALDGDGCSSACEVEFGYVCVGAVSACEATCADGLKATEEGCDDGNQDDGDGCSRSCLVERGFACEGIQPSLCANDCGDGIIMAEEACDDGDDDDLNWCNNDCQLQLVCEPEEPCWPLLHSEIVACFDDDRATSYCPGMAQAADCSITMHCGQDFQYDAGLRANLEIRGSGPETTAYDSRTGVSWQRQWLPLSTPDDATCDGGHCPYHQAVLYCDTLQYAGYDDWRLPTQPELDSIVDYGRAEPALDTFYFSRFEQAPDNSGFVWSSTPALSRPELNNQGIQGSWGLLPSLGHQESWLDWNRDDGIVMCARSSPRTIVDPPSAERFVRTEIEGEGRFHDRRTELTWTEATANLTAWASALVVCEQLVYAGRDDWRVPNIRELRSLVSYVYPLGEPATAQPQPQFGQFWTSTSNANTTITDGVPGTSYAWAVDFMQGDSLLIRKTHGSEVRCVGGGL